MVLKCTGNKKTKYEVHRFILHFEICPLTAFGGGGVVLDIRILLFYEFRH